jgi:hypothetical protein
MEAPILRGKREQSGIRGKSQSKSKSMKQGIGTSCGMPKRNLTTTITSTTIRVERTVLRARQCLGVKGYGIVRQVYSNRHHIFNLHDHKTYDVMRLWPRCVGGKI